MASQPSDVGKDPERNNVPPVNPNVSTSAPAPPTEVEDFPDPDEDDLDDLDDFLPEFSTQKQDATKAEKPAVGPVPPPAADASATAAGEDAMLNPDDFAEFEKGMATLFGELGSSPEMKTQLEKMFKEIAEAAGEEIEESSESANPTKPSASTSRPGSSAGPSTTFQDKIQETMERMKSSGDRTTEELNQGGAKDIMEELVGLLGQAELGGEGGEEDFNKMITRMMQHLTEKEILYEPMKELHEQFPGWLQENRDKLSQEELDKYEKQRVVVAEIVAKYEEPTYVDDNESDRQYIVKRMEKMQEAGSPPPDLVTGLPTAQEASNADLANMEGCNPQ